MLPGNIPGLGNLQKQMQKMQQDMVKMQEELDAERLETAAGGGLSITDGAGEESPRMGCGGSNASGVASAVGLSAGSDGRDDGIAGGANGTTGEGVTSGFGPSHVRSPDESSPTVAAAPSARGESSIARQNDRSAARR